MRKFSCLIVQFGFFFGALAYAHLSIAYAEITIITHPATKNQWTEKQVHDLYVGTLRAGQVRVLEQTDSEIRKEFYDKFLQKSEAQMKKIWSVLIFSGQRAPSLAANNQATLDYVKTHPDSIGYVSSQFWKLELTKPDKERPVVLFVVK